MLPEDVVAELAGRLAERARSAGPAALTGPDGLLSGIIGQVLQAGLTALARAVSEPKESGSAH